MPSLMMTACVGPLLLDAVTSSHVRQTLYQGKFYRAINRVDGTRPRWWYSQQDHGPGRASSFGVTWQVLV